MEKENLVLLHGWGMNSKIWHDLIAELKGQFQIYTIDVCSPPTQNLDDYLESLLAQAPSQAHWLGWSLGGMLATLISARNTARVQSLILISTNAVFCQEDGWPEAMNKATYHAFRQRLVTDSQRTFKEFIQLHFLGVRQGKRFTRELLALSRLNAWSESELVAGLDWLAQLNCLSALERLPQPVLMINGALDRITPVASVAAIRQLNPDVEVEILKNAGHAPFICHQQKVVRRILQFLAAQ